MIEEGVEKEAKFGILKMNTACADQDENRGGE